jgi:quinol monooxygenase YgiN
VPEVIIAGWMDYSSHRDEVLGHSLAVGEATRAETGCLAYVMSADPAAPGRIQVFERWSSQQALDEHLATEHVRQFRKAIADFPRVDRSLARFVIDSVAVF